MTKNAQINILNKLLDEISDLYDISSLSLFNEKKNEIIRLVEKIKRNAHLDTDYTQRVKNIAIETKKLINFKNEDIHKKKLYSSKIVYAD